MLKGIFRVWRGVGVLAVGTGLFAGKIYMDEDSDYDGVGSSIPLNIIESMKIQNLEKVIERQLKHLQVEKQNEQKSQLNNLEQVCKNDENLEQLSSILQQNEVIMGAGIPKSIIDYAQSLNYQIKTISTLENQLILMNKAKDIKKFNLNNIRKEGKDELLLIANFLNPPHLVQNINQARNFLNLIGKDNFLVAAYIPQENAYEQQINQKIKSQFDTYSLNRKKQIKQIIKQYKQLKYNSSSPRNTYIITQSKQVAQFMKISTKRIGQPYIYNQSSQLLPNSNVQIMNKPFYLHSLKTPLCGLSEQVNHYTHFSLQKIKQEEELVDTVRQMQMSKDNRKLLIFHSQENDQKFHQKVDTILTNVARMCSKDAIAVKVENPKILRDILKIQCEGYATIRLIDIHKTQPPQIQGYKSNQQFFKRMLYKGPFQTESLCRFVQKQKWQEYYEHKKNLSNMKGIQLGKKLQDEFVLLVQKKGCKGCDFVEGLLNQLKTVLKLVKSAPTPKLADQIILKYKISSPQLLNSVKFRKLNIISQHQEEALKVSSTPKLFFYKDGQYYDLQVETILKDLKINENGYDKEDLISNLISKIQIKLKSIDF